MSIWTVELYVNMAESIIHDYETGEKMAGTVDRVWDWMFSCRIAVTEASLRVHLSALKRAARILFRLDNPSLSACRKAVKSCFKSRVVDRFEMGAYKVFRLLGLTMHEHIRTASLASSRASPATEE